MTLRLNGSTSGYVEIDAPAVAGNNTLILPGGNGSNGQVLTTNGSGTLSWADRMTAAGPAFSAFRNATQSITSSTWTKVQLNNEDFDTAGAFDSTTNYRFTPQTAGYYLITFSVAGTVAYNEALSAVYKNGSEYLWGSRTASSSASYTSSGSVVMYLNGSTDYVELFAWLSSGTAPSLAAAHNRMTGCLLRPA